MDRRRRFTGSSRVFIPGTFVAFLGTSGIITGIVVYFLIFPSAGNLDFGFFFPHY
ncbi:hypothetical protein LEP1GSC116_2279 [Leptospira interrogans serovar Icterohaemorrhagiae str. Verdun HP]|uniref:Uncharacterized protein n=1 Tax=Leptospira interrogans serovar Icterohaemorrhagiae str. Verdun HP TaxID=1049910 RepID=M6RKS4_LEPIR|nr:hypothetical protein LEP1GSC116_2279 [Leptospira interrogans serovar Icterohaemorrhagiae str. Verdun HP]